MGTFVLGIKGQGNSLFVPIPAAILAAITSLYSLWAYFFAHERRPFLVGLIAYSILGVTIGALLAGTGGAWSPFTVLWLLFGVFAGLFGWRVWLAVATAANALLIFDLFFAGNTFTSDKIIEVILVSEVPLIISYLIWHDKTKHEEGAGDTNKITALTQQLSQVSNESDIVINSIADSVIAIDEKGIILLLNPAAQTLLGWSARDAVGLDYRSVIKLVDQGGKPIAEDFTPISQVMRTNRAMTNNAMTLVTKSAKKVFVALTVSPVENNAQTHGVIAVFRDVTQEKEEERHKAEFISTASHEMRTPVAAIEGYLSLALNTATATIDDKARMYLQKAHESTQHLGRLFQDLLTVSKAEDARLIPHPTAVDVVEFTAKIVEGLQPKAKGKNLFLSFKPATQTAGNRLVMPVYYGYFDQDQLREVLNNLVDNAVKYTKQGSVVVDVTGDAESVTVSIADSGIGIPPEDVTHLFQKFYRVDNSDTREIGGTGLGLYISRRLIEANNGRIGVQSIYGKGSTFYVQLPRITMEKATQLQTSNQAAPNIIAPAPTTQPVAVPQAPPPPPQPPQPLGPPPTASAT